jgi:hypothetical protein
MSASQLHSSLEEDLCVALDELNKRDDLWDDLFKKYEAVVKKYEVLQQQDARKQQMLEHLAATNPKVRSYLEGVDESKLKCWHPALSWKEMCDKMCSAR